MIASYSDYRYLLGVLMIRPLRDEGVDGVDAASLTHTGASAGFFLLIDLSEGFKAFLLPFLDNLI
jgi:hypothetical protein